MRDADALEARLQTAESDDPRLFYEFYVLHAALWGAMVGAIAGGLRVAWSYVTAP